MIHRLTLAIVLTLTGASFAQKAALLPPVWKAGAASVTIPREALMWMAGFTEGSRIDHPPFPRSRKTMMEGLPTGVN